MDFERMIDDSHIIKADILRRGFIPSRITALAIAITTGTGFKFRTKRGKGWEYDFYVKGYGQYPDTTKWSECQIFK